MSRALKTVHYRGGVVTMRVPESWCEHYEPDGGAIFWDDGVDTPNFRIDVLTARGPATTADTAANALRRRPGTIELLANGTALVRHVVPAEEEGTRLLITRWEIAQAIPPDHLRVVMFSWTILGSQEADPAVREQGELLDREIRAAVIPPEIGISGSWYPPAANE